MTTNKPCEKWFKLFAILVCFSFDKTGASSASSRAHITALCTVTSCQGWTPTVTLTLINCSQFLSVRVIIFPNSPCLVTQPPPS